MLVLLLIFSITLMYCISVLLQVLWKLELIYR